MTLKRISKKKIVGAINELNHQQDYAYHSDMRIAQAQLKDCERQMKVIREADLKEYEELKAQSSHLLEMITGRLVAQKEAHNAVIREMENRIDYLEGKLEDELRKSGKWART